MLGQEMGRTMTSDNPSCHNAPHVPPSSSHHRNGLNMPERTFKPFVFQEGLRSDDDEDDEGDEGMEIPFKASARGAELVMTASILTPSHTSVIDCV